jgi:hypothetical protein
VANFSLDQPGLDLSAAGDLLGGIGSAIGDFAKASQYGNSAETDKIMMGATLGQTRLRKVAQERAAYGLVGAQHAAIAQSGLAESGTALDVLRQSARDASLDQQLIQYKGMIDYGNWQLKYKSDKAAESASTLGGVLDIVKGVATAAAVLA